MRRIIREELERAMWSLMVASMSGVLVAMLIFKLFIWTPYPRRLFSNIPRTQAVWLLQDYMLYIERHTEPGRLPEWNECFLRMQQWTGCIHDESSGTPPEPCHERLTSLCKEEWSER